MDLDDALFDRVRVRPVVHEVPGAIGDLAGVVLERASAIDIPTLIWRSLSQRARVARHRRVHAFTGVSGLRVRSLDQRPLPLQVDGDYIGEVHEASFGLTPGGIAILA